MTHIRVLLVGVIAALLAMQLSHAAQDQFDPDIMLGDLEKRLKLSADELSKARPVIERQSRELKNAIQETVDEGFMQLESLSGRLESAAEEATGQLRDVLSSDQVQELKTFLAGIDAQAIEEARNELVDELTRLLELTGEQIESLRPMIREEIEKRGELLSRFTADAGESLETFKQEYEALAEQTRARLNGALDGEQLKILEQHQGELSERIRSKLFPEG